MTANYLNSLPSPFPVNDQQHELYSTKPHASSSSSLSNTLALTYTIEDQEGHHQRAVNQLRYQQLANNLAPQGESCDHAMPKNTESSPGLKFFIWKKEDGNDQQNQSEVQKGTSSAKWMSSKIRLMGKVMKSDCVAVEAPTSSELKFEDHHQESSSSPLETHDPYYSCNSSTSNINTLIRVCSDCNTTKTPLWRSGPRGPKSLCNACGIRQRKARRAMAAATNVTTILAAQGASALKSKVQHKEKKSKTGHIAPYKKRFKFSATSNQGIRKKLCFEDFLINLNKNLASQSVFPQDEKEAAILLMALSYGLVHG